MTMIEQFPPAERTVPRMLAQQQARFGARQALVIGDQSWSHAQVQQMAACRASVLQTVAQRGDRVALMCGNRPEFLECFLGAAWAGLVSVPVNTASMGPQIEYFLANSQTRLLVIEAQYLARLEQADLSQSQLQAIWVLDADDSLPAQLQGVALQRWPGAGEPAAAADVKPGETLAILYTSGTTGPPKGVLCSHAQYYWWGMNSLRVLHITGDDVLCTTLPLFHVNALNTFAQAMLSGCSVVFEQRFSASGFWTVMQERGATVVYLLGAMVPILLAQAPGEHERQHGIRLGLGPGVPAKANDDFFARTGVRLLEGYGSTETNFVIATSPDFVHRGVMGHVLPGFEARVADEDDVELPVGEAGELLLRATEPYAFASGYFGMPDKTVEAWRNLWFHTGDRVVREADGCLRFMDRIKDAIRRRGENISSYEVEQVLLSHPAVATVAVFPVRSELAEDDVMTALIAKPGSTLDLPELVAWCEARLPYFAVPRYFDVVDDLPRTENGKVQKYKLRERGITASSWERPNASAGRAKARA